MKKIIISLITLFISLSAMADITGNGYYRVKNYGSSRWASLIDNTGSVDFVATTADLHALYLNNNTEEILSDPGSIIYLTNISGKQFDVAAQGTSLETLVNQPIYIGATNGKGTDGQTLYRIWGTYSGITKYIGDQNLVNSQQIGNATINDLRKYPNYMNWEFYPLSVTSENYFGAVPTLTVNGQSYCTLFTSFPYAPYSSGVKAYYIGRVGFGMAEMIEITGTVPSGSPVIIQCVGQNVSNNKLELKNSQEVLPNNSLKGVYFDYNAYGRKNQVKYDPSTMRVLGKCSDGSLGFITSSDLEYIPANTAYLSVPAGSAPEFKCVTTSQYETGLPDAPEQIYVNDSIILQPQDDYTYSTTTTINAISGSDSLKIRFYTTENPTNEDTIGVNTSYGKDYTFNLSGPVTTSFSYGSPYYWVLSNWGGGQITITLNLQYQTVNFSSQNASIETIKEREEGLVYRGKTIFSDLGDYIRVVNMAGQTMAESNSGSLDISTLPKGIYIAISGSSSIKIVR